MVGRRRSAGALIARLGGDFADLESERRRIGSQGELEAVGALRGAMLDAEQQLLKVSP
jgi:hypothetical protein